MTPARCVALLGFMLSLMPMLFGLPARSWDAGDAICRAALEYSIRVRGNSVGVPLDLPVFYPCKTHFLPARHCSVCSVLLIGDFGVGCCSLISWGLIRLWRSTVSARFSIRRLGLASSQHLSAFVLPLEVREYRAAESSTARPHLFGMIANLRFDSSVQRNSISKKLRTWHPCSDFLRSAVLLGLYTAVF